MVLSYQSLKKLVHGEKPMIRGGVLDEHIQPASIDLLPENFCFRVSVSTSPKQGERIQDLLSRFSMYPFALRSEGVLLEKGMTYIIPLDAFLDLPEYFRVSFSSKSTSGRNDVVISAMTNSNPELNTTIFGYKGQLYIEATPLSWHTVIYPEKPLIQMRVHTRDDKALSTEQLEILHSEYGIVRNKEGEPTEAVISDGALYLHLDLIGERVGHESIINPEGQMHLGKKEVDKYEDFFRPIRLTGYGDAILHPDTFYLLATKERIFIPPTVCAVMEQYSPNFGDFSTHEAGFFDNNFGSEGGTQGVLEVHVNKRKPIRVWDSRPICRMVFYKTDEVPECLYGSGTNTYIGSGPSLPKNIINFRNW